MKMICELHTLLLSHLQDTEKMKMDSEKLSKRVQDLEILEHDKQAASNLEQELRNNITELEEQLVEKNKVINCVIYLSFNALSFHAYFISL
jgi:hypothetical protein